MGSFCALTRNAFDIAVEPIVEMDGGMYAIEFALCRAPPEGVVLRKRPAEVLGIAWFFQPKGIPMVFLGRSYVPI